jgi:hypothetical protein
MEAVYGDTLGPIQRVSGFFEHKPDFANTFVFM